MGRKGIGLPRGSDRGVGQGVGTAARALHHLVGQPQLSTESSLKPMTGIDKARLVRNAGIAKFSQFVSKHLYSTDWTLVAATCAVDSILDDPIHGRVRSAQHFGDEDYVSAISGFLQDVFDEDEHVGRFLVHSIVQQDSGDEPLTDQAKEELNQILSMLGGHGSAVTTMLEVLQPPVVEDFVEVTWVPDDFYRGLIDEINSLYGSGLPLSLSVMIRKLFEVLIADLLRKRFGRKNVELFFDPGQRRFHDFSTLLRKIEEHRAQYHYLAPGLDRSIIRRIGKYREAGNSASHSIDADLTMDQHSDSKADINYLVRFLLRILQNL